MIFKIRVSEKHIKGLKNTIKAAIQDALKEASGFDYSVKFYSKGRQKWVIIGGIIRTPLPEQVARVLHRDFIIRKMVAVMKKPFEFNLELKLTKEEVAGIEQLIKLTNPHLGI